MRKGRYAALDIIGQVASHLKREVDDSLVEGKVIGGGVLELECVQVVCPACQQQVEAVAWGSHH